MQLAGPFITGRGLVTALGDSAERTWEKLLAGEYIRTHARAVLPDDCSRPRVTQLALRAACEAIESARWGGQVLRDDRTALLIGTSRGPINEWISGKPQDRLIGVHSVAEDVARELRMGRGPRLSYSAACASSLQALIRACLMLRTGEADRALVIGAEASLHPLFVQCFQRLGVLPSEGVGCRPFDEAREGFLVSEAAAAVCLEASAGPLGGVAVGRCAMGSDAATITSAEPSGNVLAAILRQAMTGTFDLVHAHGTGTVANDPAELAAIEQNTPPASSPPWIYSHKGALGHSLGASGLVSVVLSTQMHAHGIVLPNVRTTRPIHRQRARLSTAAMHAPIRRSVCIAAGFGGPVAAVELGSVKT